MIGTYVPQLGKQRQHDSGHYRGLGLLGSFHRANVYLVRVRALLIGIGAGHIGWPFSFARPTPAGHAALKKPEQLFWFAAQIRPEMVAQPIENKRFFSVYIPTFWAYSGYMGGNGATHIAKLEYDMTTRIITKAQAHDMANQLASLGGTKETTETGIVVKAPNGKTAFRAMIGTGGTMLARWPDGLFDERVGA